MSHLYRFGQFVLDPKRRTLVCHDSPIPLTPKAFDILVFLAQNPNRIISKDELLRAVWADTFVEEGNLAQHISVLRKVLAEKSEERLIITIARKGYQFSADVAAVEVDTTRSHVAQAGPIGVSAIGAGVKTATDQEAYPSQPPTFSDLATAERAVPKPKNRSRVFAVLSAVALILGVAGYIYWRNTRRLSVPSSPPATLQKTMLAVMPFQNLTGDPKQDYLADGLTEEIIAQLARLQPERLGVIARTSVMGYKHSDKRLDQIGRDLSVQYVLENSLRRSAGRFRITVQLIRVDDQSHLWAEDYDYRLRDVIGLEDDVSRSIVQQIRLRLTPQEQTELTRSRQVDPGAFDAYLEGHHYFEQNREEDVERAVSYYEQAVKLDSSYALAWVALSRARYRQANNGAVPVEEGQRRAREAAERALALDPNLAAAHAQMARIRMFIDWDWAGADASVQRALALDPGNSTVLGLASELAAIHGRFDEALELARRSVALDPLNAVTRASLGILCFHIGRQDEAVVDFKKSLELNPDVAFIHQDLGMIYLAQGRAQDALPEVEQEPDLVSRLLGHSVMYYALGRKKDSDTALDELVTKYQDSAAAQIAEAYAFRGESDKAFQWLDRAYVQHDGALATTNLDPLLKDLHGDPRYVAFLKKIHLPS